MVRGQGRAAVAAVLAGMCWAGTVWSLERVNGADALVGAGMLLAPLLVPVLILLVLALPGLTRLSRSVASILVVGAATIAVAGVARAVVYEPILDVLRRSVVTARC